MCWLPATHSPHHTQQLVVELHGQAERQDVSMMSKTVKNWKEPSVHHEEHSEDIGSTMPVSTPGSLSCKSQLLGPMFRALLQRWRENEQRVMEKCVHQGLSH